MGLIIEASPPASETASLIAAISTATGTPVKSCSTTLPGIYGNSLCGFAFGLHEATSLTCSKVAGPWSLFRNTFSKRTLIE